MARKVKGSKQYRMKVVPHRPFWGPLSIVGVALLVLTTTAAAFYAGQHHLRQTLDQKSRDFTYAQKQLDKLHADNESLRQRAITAEQSLTIGQKAGEKVRAELVAKDDRIAELKQEISFYRGLMAPADGSDGVSIGRFSISQTTDPRRFQFKLLVQQSATRHNVVTGHATFTVVGSQDGQPKRFPLSALSAQVDSESIPLRFKYFQNIEGELQLPQGFEPEGVELSLKSGGRKGFNIDQRYGWLVQKS
ncbi:DUF6776 family protein [Microbulbifer sp. SAOS-129_SWC]|uniref:DUF6776 family protein n=1 Tax=Microbulbifer sp. SAOS-129_SWC TaxID=3145235 RepID=UPI00321627CA